MATPEAMMPPMFIRPRMMAPISAASLPNPMVRKSIGEKKADTVTPVRFRNTGNATAITRYGRYSRRRIRRNAPSWFRRSCSTAASMSLNSASTSTPLPRTRWSAARAWSCFPRRTRLLGVSVMSTAPSTMTAAGTAARPRDRRQPHSGIRDVP
ncbi:unnamed protein product [Triticum aestivum]|uniref:Uncharacterized protein n=3 Tax=Triticum TaxID=4564 RepID=A0A2X0S783_WHEAT|nr:hypothetical protein CFC21_023981 [Triticum aestivum]KAF7016755.1 hypothetical protein CFC21_030288 [Triticum aestivum]KAF7016759.1 hypothetical protein CFC21_030292 [Triticum aestivum]SPT18587.1 unnamed protein product [Triticum aestivum]VAH48374.1 unnamed protein product [Triticum turgidum subsp. durum]